MRITARLWAPLVFAASLGLGERAAQAFVSDDPLYQPPDGWANLCTGTEIAVKPSLTTREYTGVGVCWINTAQNKSDVNHQEWVQAHVAFAGSWELKASTYSERLNFAIPQTTGTATIPVTTSGRCTDDPWAAASQCSGSAPNVNLSSSFGWSVSTPSGPLSHNVFGSALIAALLQKQASNPPLAPVDLDVVRWPAIDGSGTQGRLFWRAPDVSGNRFILAYDVEYAINSMDSAFSNGGHVVGPGAKSSLTPSDITRFFYTTFKLMPGDYYFRVCSTNDVGRQCSAPLKAREPTKAELMSVAHNHVQTKIVMQAGGSTPPAAPPPVAVTPPPARVRMAPTALPAPGH